MTGWIITNLRVPYTSCINKLYNPIYEILRTHYKISNIQLFYKNGHSLSVLQICILKEAKINIFVLTSNIRF